MTAKEYLLKVRRAEKLIELKKHEIEKLRIGLEYKAVNYGSERVQSSNTRDRTDALCELIDFEHELKKQIEELIELKREVMQKIDSIQEADLVTILYLRYLDNLHWEEIAAKMNYSHRWILKLHGRALREIENILKKDI